MNPPTRDLFDIAYPALPKGVSLHRTPEQGAVFTDSRSVGTYRGKKMALRMPAISYVNAGAIEILSRFDGTRAGSAVLREYATEHQAPYETVAPALKAFLQQANQSGHLEFLSQPELRPPKVTGSRDFWMPTNVCIELTARCNLRCQHCYRESSGLPEEALSTDFLLRLLESLVADGVRIAELTGGEPMMRRGFREIFEYCAENMASLALLTNGTLVNDRMADLLVRYRDKVVVGVSLDSPTPEFHDRFRAVSGAHARTCEAIRRLSDAGVMVRVAMSVVPENSHLIEETLKLSESLGAVGFAYNPVLPFGRGKDIDWSVLSSEQLVELHRSEACLPQEHPEMLLVISEESLDKVKSYGNCGAGSRSITIDPLGNVRICQMADGPFFTLGNLTASSLAEIMAGPQARFFRNLRPPEPEVCGDCRYVPLCKLCALRGIVTFASHQPDCAWARANGLDRQKVSEVPALSKAACSIYAQTC